MRIDVKIEGSEKVLAALSRLSQGQIDDAVRYGLQDGGKFAANAIRKEMRAVFDRPTRYVLNSVNVLSDTNGLGVTIHPTYYGGQGVDPQHILQAQEFGGPRRAKRAERVLQQTGYLPAGWVTVPGQGARLDASGNMSGGQLMQILSQLRAQTTAGYTRNMAHGKRGIKAQERAGGRFFVIPPGGRVQPGVYQREFMGRGITPVLIFVRAATYSPRLGMERIAQKAGLEEYVQKRIRYHIYDAAEKAK